MPDWPKFDFGYLTLFTKDLEKTKAFYEAIGIEFTRHDRTSGGYVYSAEIAPRVYLSLQLGDVPSNCDLHFGVLSYGNVAQKLKALGYGLSSKHYPANPRGTFTYYDPDGRKVGLDEFG